MTDIFGLNFDPGFIEWLGTLTIIQVISILVFAIIDMGRNFGKILALTIHRLRIKAAPPRKVITNRPKITLLIPAHNESVSIKKTIISILENNYPNREIIIIDDYSTDDTFEQASEFEKKGLIRIFQRKEGKGSKAAAINFGAVYATGDILMIMDGDTLIERNVLKEIAKYMDDPKVAAVAGNVRILSGDNGINNILTKCQSYEIRSSF